jgi:hypothetical protein
VYPDAAVEEIARADEDVDSWWIHYQWSPGSSWHFSVWDTSFPGDQTYTAACATPHKPKHDRQETIEMEAQFVRHHAVRGECREAWMHIGHQLHPLQDEFAHGQATVCDHLDAANYPYIDNVDYDTDWVQVEDSPRPFESADGWRPVIGAAGCNCHILEDGVRVFNWSSGYRRLMATSRATTARLEQWLRDLPPSCVKHVAV